MRIAPSLLICAVLSGLSLAGCADFPKLDAAISPEARRAAYPDLVPIDTVLDRRKLARTTGREAAMLETRAENLRRRAAMLRGITIDEETRLRLTPGLIRLGG